MDSGRSSPLGTGCTIKTTSAPTAIASAMAETGTSKERRRLRRSHQTWCLLRPAKMVTAPASIGKKRPRCMPPSFQGMRRARTPWASSWAAALLSAELKTTSAAMPSISVTSPAAHNQLARRTAANRVAASASRVAQPIPSAAPTSGMFWNSPPVKLVSPPGNRASSAWALKLRLSVP